MARFFPKFRIYEVTYLEHNHTENNPLFTLIIVSRVLTRPHLLSAFTTMVDTVRYTGSGFEVTGLGFVFTSMSWLHESFSQSLAAIIRHICHKQKSVLNDTLIFSEWILGIAENYR